MFGLSEHKDLERIHQLTDPRHAEAWFRRLDPGRRRQMIAEWRQDLAHSFALLRAARRRFLLEVLGAGALFLVLDGLFCMSANAGTMIIMTSFGMIAGLLWNFLETTRLSSPVVTMITFTAGVLASRGGGISIQHFLIGFLAGGASVWIGLRREEGWH